MARRDVARRTGRVAEGEIDFPDMTTDELQSLLENVIAKELKVLDARLDAMDKALLLQTGELGRRLDALNHDADRRSSLEREDREQYVQAIEFKEFRNENGTWRAQIEKELRGYPRTSDVQTWVAVLQKEVDGLDIRATANTKRLDANQVGEEVRGRQRASQQWKLVAITGFVSTVLAGLVFIALNWVITGK